MKILYDQEGDILDVMFNDHDENGATAGYELRQGTVVYLSNDMSPVQLTLVNYRRMTELPVVYFDRLKAQPNELREKLLALLSSMPLSSILKIDPTTFYGHVVNPELLDVCHV